MRGRSTETLARKVVERLPRLNLLSFPAGNGLSSGGGRWAAPGSAGWWPSTRGWEANLDDWLDFSPDSVAQACFSLPPELPSAPQRTGFGLEKKRPGCPVGDAAGDTLTT